MIDERWFETVGKRHLKKFFGQIENAFAEGKARGLKPKRINIDDFFRIYRGEYTVLSDEQIKQINKLYQDEWTIAELAERYSCCRETIRSHVRRKNVVPDRARSKSS